MMRRGSLFSLVLLTATLDRVRREGTGANRGGGAAARSAAAAAARRGRL